MIIKKVEIINMHHIEFASYNFENLNYLYGLNGAGKSTILQAIQLGLLGYIPGTGKRNADIIKHKTPGTTRMEVDLTLVSDSSEYIRIRRIYTATKTGASCKCEFYPDCYDEKLIQNMLSKVELPVFNFEEFLNLTPNALKKWFLDYVPSGGDDNLDIEKELLSYTKDNTENISDEIIQDLIHSIHFPDSSQDTVARLKDVNTQLKDLLKFKKIEQDTNQKTINSLIFYPDATFTRTVEERVGLMHELNESIVRFRSAKRDLESNTTINNALQERYKDLPEDESEDEVISSLRCQLDGITSKMQECNESSENLRLHLAELSQAMKVITPFLSSNGVCPITSEMCNSISSKLDDYKKQYDELHSEYVETDSKIKQITSDKTKLVTKHNSLQNDLLQRQKLYIDRDNLRSRLVDVDDTVDYDFCIEDATRQLEELQDEQAQYLANDKYNNTIKSFESMKYKLEIEMQVIKLWINHTSESGLQSNYMTDPLNNIVEELNRYLITLFNDKTISAYFNVASKSNSFSFGIQRDGVYIPYDLLSSGEKCMYLVAFISYLASTSPVNVVLVDDLFDHLDKPNLKFIIDGMKSISSAQYIIAGVQDIDTNDLNVMKIRR